MGILIEAVGGGSGWDGTEKVCGAFSRVSGNDGATLQVSVRR